MRCGPCGAAPGAVGVSAWAGGGGGGIGAATVGGGGRRANGPSPGAAWLGVGRGPARPAWLKVARHVLTAVAACPEERVPEAEAVAPLRAEHPAATVSLQQVADLLQGAEAPSWARSAAEAGRKARRSAAARTSVVEAAVAAAEEPDAAVAEVRPQVAAHAAGLRPAAECAAAAPEAAAVLGDAAVPRPEVAAELDAAVPLLAAVRLEVAAVAALLGAVAVQLEAAEEAVRRRAAPGGEAARRGAVAWVFRLDRLLPWPGPRQAARSAHAQQERSTASP